MTTLSAMTSVALVGALAAAPAAAQQNQNQQQMQNQQNQQPTQQQLGQQQLSQQGQACIDELEAKDQELSELGYGRPGPGGYGIYGASYAMPAAEPGTGSDVTDRPLAASPRADMYALMRAGYVMARTGHDEGCQQVLAVVEDIGSRYREAIQQSGYQTGMADWRSSYLTDTTSVTELEQPLHAEQIIGADLRNPQDEDLGDIEDVVIGPNGEIRYVIASAGGFLGVGEERVPVPWQELEITAAPYNDTLVLDVSQQAFENAPRLEGTRQQLATGDRGQRIETYWQQQADTGGEKQQDQ